MTTKKPHQPAAAPSFTSSEVLNIIAALSAVQAFVTLSERDQTGMSDDGREYAYSSLGATWETVRELQGQNGLALVQRFTDLGMHTVLYHTSGEWIDFGHYDLGDNDTHGDFGAAISFARRYTLATVYGIAAKAEDDSAASHQRISRSAFAAETAAIVNPPSFWQHNLSQRAGYVSLITGYFRNSKTMDELRGHLDSQSLAFNEILSNGNIEDKAAVAEIRAAFDAQRDALSQPGRRRTVDSATRN